MTAEERLALVLAKVDRADKHIIELNGEIIAFYKTNPYKIISERNPQTRQLVYKLSRVDAVPKPISAIAGDVVQNLRSALDHLAQQLWLVNNPGAVSVGDVYFPTDSSSSQFKANAPGKIKGLRKDAVDAIYSIEPYDGGKGADLSVINRLNRIDKHRLLFTVQSQLESVNVGIVLMRGMQELFTKMWPDKVAPKIDLYIGDGDKSSLQVGSELFIDAPDAKEHKHMDFKIGVSLYEPGVVEGEPVLKKLQDFSKLVRAIILQFKPYLA